MVETIEFGNTAQDDREAKPSADSMAALMFEGYPDLMTPANVAQALGLGIQATREYIKRGKVPGCKIGQRWYVPKIALAEMVLKGETI